MDAVKYPQMRSGGHRDEEVRWYLLEPLNGSRPIWLERFPEDDDPEGLEALCEEAHVRVRIWEKTRGDVRPRGTDLLYRRGVLGYERLDLLAWLHSVAGWEYRFRQRRKDLTPEMVARQEHDIRYAIRLSDERPAFLDQCQRSPDGKWIGYFGFFDWPPEAWGWIDREDAASSWVESDPEGHDIMWWGGRTWVALRERPDAVGSSNQSRLENYFRAP